MMLVSGIRPYLRGNPMNYQTIGSTEYEASRIAMGVMRMAGKTPEEARAIVQTALDCGMNFFDSADIYGAGDSSRALGQALRDLGVDRQDVILQTKFGIAPDFTGKRNGIYDFSRDHLLSSLEAELERLQTDHVDFVLLHRLDALCDLDELGDTMAHIVDSGMARHIGVSNMGPWSCEMLQANLDQKLEVNQLQFGLRHAGMVRMQMHENMEDDDAADRDGGALSYAQLTGMTIQAWSPLQYGMFAGTFIDDEQFAELNGVLAQIAEERGVSKEAVAIAWILRHPARMQVISGSMNPERIRAIAAGAVVELTRQEWYALYIAAGNDLP